MLSQRGIISAGARASSAPRSTAISSSSRHTPGGGSFLPRPPAPHRAQIDGDGAGEIGLPMGAKKGSTDPGKEGESF